MKSKRTLKNIFLNESLGSKKEQEELMQVQNAVISMKSLIDKDVIDKGNPAFKSIEDAVNNLQSLLSPKEINEGPFDDAFAKHEEESKKEPSLDIQKINKQNSQNDKVLTTKLDEPFQKHIKECPMDDAINIEVGHPINPHDLEFVELIFPESDVEETSFKPAGSPNFDERENEIVSEEQDALEFVDEMDEDPTDNDNLGI
jgi:hypothetical protein